MIRHTKQQVLGGEVVLQLPPKTEEDVAGEGGEGGCSCHPRLRRMSRVRGEVVLQLPPKTEEDVAGEGSEGSRSHSLVALSHSLPLLSCPAPTSLPSPSLPHLCPSPPPLPPQSPSQRRSGRCTRRCTARCSASGWPSTPRGLPSSRATSSRWAGRGGGGLPSSHALPAHGVGGGEVGAGV